MSAIFPSVPQLSHIVVPTLRPKDKFVAYVMKQKSPKS